MGTPRSFAAAIFARFLHLLSLLGFCAGTLLAAPVSVIFDTDMNGDCDDAGALAVLHALADRGEAELALVVVNTGDELGNSGAAVDVINTYYGRPDIPIGAWQAPTRVEWKTSPFARALREEFPHDAKVDKELPDATMLLRRTLAEAADQSLVYCSAGALSNMAALLQSPPDEISPLSGRELVIRKIRRTVVMGGGKPRDPPPRPEANLRFDPPAAIKVAQDWPGPMLWSQDDVGWAIITGSELNPLPKSNPVRRAYELRPFRDRSSLDQGKPSHDQAVALLAVRGVQPELWDIVVRGRVEITPELSSEWHPDPQGPHSRMGIKGDPAKLAAIIGSLMSQLPMAPSAK